MPDSPDSDANATDTEIRRVCSILEIVAKQYPDDSPESAAIADAAQAFILVRQHESLSSAYRKLKSAHNGELSDEIIANLRSHGIDPSELDGADY